jgi:adenylate kinase family enzyme
MREYHKLTEAVLDHYRKQGLPIHEIDGVGSPDEVFERIKQALTGISSREG